MKDKVVWITGASSGIGEALVHELSRRGAKLIISSRRSEALYHVKENAGGERLDIHVLPLDLEQADNLRAKAAEAIKIFGRIDIIIHSGGVSQRSLAMDTLPEVEERIMNINFWGTVALTKAVLPAMISQGGGRIVVISSLVGKFGTRFRSAYSASKHALHGYFDSLRTELFDENIAITIICPGFIRTSVTINALTADGSAQNKMDDAQAKGMAPEECARQIVSAVNAGKDEAYIGGKEKYGVLIRRFFPGIFSKMIRKAKVV